MAATVTALKRPVTSKWQDIINKITNLGFDYTDEPEFDLTKIDEDKRVQVREMGHYAPAEAVKRFREQMAQLEFPPMVLTQDDYLVDGNTRAAASKLNKTGFFHAFVLDVNYDTTTEEKRRKLRILAASLNCRTGIVLTVAERRKRVEDCLAQDWKVEHIRRELGLSGGIVAQVKREVEGRRKLALVGLNPGDFPMPILRGLGHTKVLPLNIQPYHDLALLAKDAGLNQTEIVTIAKEMREAGADEKAIEVVDKKRREMHERITNYHFTGNGKASKATLLRQRLGFITGYEGQEELLIEHSDDATVVEHYLDTIKRSIRVLTKLTEVQTNAA